MYFNTLGIHRRVSIQRNKVRSGVVTSMAGWHAPEGEAKREKIREEGWGRRVEGHRAMFLSPQACRVRASLKTKAGAC